MDTKHNHEIKTNYLDPVLQPQTEIWLKEQYDISSQVIVLQDDDDDDDTLLPHQQHSSCCFSNRFIRVPLDDLLGAHDNSNSSNCYYGGVDVSFLPPSSPSSSSDDDDSKLPCDAVAVYVIVDAANHNNNNMNVVYVNHEFFTLPADHPYIPGFLAMREIEPLQRLVDMQRREHPELTPAAILVDGNGQWHPRQAGIACFLGVRCGIPTIGIGKSFFCLHGHRRDDDDDGSSSSLLTKECVWRGIEESLAVAVEEHMKHEHNPMIQRPDLQQQNNIETNNHCVWMDRAPIHSAARTSGAAAAREDHHTGTTTGRPNIHNNDTQSCRGELVKRIAPFCQGFAVPIRAQLPQPVTRMSSFSRLTGDENKDDDNDNDDKKQSDTTTETTRSRPCPTTETLDDTHTTVVTCYGLVGHGGRMKTKQQHAKSHDPNRIQVGSANPIFVSVGHQLSLRQAVRITAFLSVSRIPEPIRQADLLGRALLRQIAAKRTTRVASVPPPVSSCEEESSNRHFQQE